MERKISFLKSRNIRDVWKREDRNFTPWLAASEPIAMLFEACGIDVGEDPKIETEVEIPGVGRSLDVLVTLDNGDVVEKIAIENQYSEGDHDHLTRALAYAVGLEARTIIIIAESHRPEFVSVVNYLNAAATTCEGGIRVFLVDITVWTGDDEKTVFPVFEVSAQPDEWKSAVALMSASGPNSNQKARYYEFHDLMLPLVRKTTGLFSNSRPTASSDWKAGWFGIGGVAVVYGIRRETAYAQIWFFRHGYPEASQAGFRLLESKKEEIEKSHSELKFLWKIEDRNYPVLEVSMDGLGTNAEFSKGKLQELAELTGLMAGIVRQYQIEIIAAMGPEEQD
jgi:hypothetical protein